MRQWFENLLSIGFAYGYFPEPSKTVLVVQSYNLLTMNDLFCNLGIRVATSSLSWEVYWRSVSGGQLCFWFGVAVFTNFLCQI